MAGLDAALRRRRAAVLNLGYPSRQRSLSELADDIHPAIQGFNPDSNGTLHLVTHSMGGLVARVYLDRHRPANLGRVVMLAPPNQGSEVADRLQHRFWFRWAFGPAGPELTTAHAATLPAPDYPVGVIAGTRSIYPLASRRLPGPNDGRVTLARTKLASPRPDGDWIAIPATHPFIMRDPEAISLTMRFLETGSFSPPAGGTEGQA